MYLYFSFTNKQVKLFPLWDEFGDATKDSPPHLLDLTGRYPGGKHLAGAVRGKARVECENRARLSGLESKYGIPVR